MITLDALAAGDGPSTHDEALALAHLLAAAQVHLALALAALSTPAAPSGNRLLDAKTAAAKLGVSVQWLYRRKLPFAMHVGGHLRYSEHGIDQYIATRRGK